MIRGQESSLRLAMLLSAANGHLVSGAKRKLSYEKSVRGVKGRHLARTPSGDRSFFYLNAKMDGNNDTHWGGEVPTFPTGDLSFVSTI